MLIDKVEGFINWPSSEYMLRRCYGLELAFNKCKGKHDWNRGTNAPKTWKSKVDWDACRRVDPRSLEAGRFRTKPVEDEVKASMERDALLSKVRFKLQEHGDPVDDPLSP